MTDDAAIVRVIGELDALLREGAFAAAYERLTEIVLVGSPEERVAALLVTYPARERLPARRALEPAP